MTDAEQASAACAARDDVSIDHLYRSGAGRCPARVRAMCSACSVQAACLEDALRIEGDAPRHLRFGIWGGTVPAERHALALARRAAKAVAV